jgi:hypothetical protein
LTELANEREAANDAEGAKVLRAEVRSFIIFGSVLQTRFVKSSKVDWCYAVAIFKDISKNSDIFYIRI